MDSETQKVYINVGLVGHVSNGKTTLVKTFSGVNTKRDSNEIKTGRTVKLGYANCLVWKCPICESIYTSGQAQKGMECCTFDLEPVQHISFLDAPGHHSYVHNMIKGSAVIDCAIVVTDVRAEALQIQTIEHLVILEAMNVRNILIVQNKVDLVDSERCLSHYNSLREELKGTVADGAPIIPISAQNGTGMVEMRKYLYELVDKVSKNLQKFPKNVFSIIRSFDINKPDTPLEKIRGGVIGGTVLGEEGFKVGDEIEIRPGYIKSATECIPITTKIFSIFSEEKKCEDMGRGGLYGVGTTLDPVLTKADGMVGCLAGKPQDLPDIVTSLEISVSRLKKSPNGDEVEKIKKGQTYQLIIGSVVVKATAEKAEGKKWKMALGKPICTLNTSCMIYTGDAKCQLIGFGTFGDVGTVLERIPIPQTEQEYISHLGTTPSEKKEKAKIPVPTLAKESCNVIWGNITVFCETIHRDPEHVSTYIKEELCMEASICQNGLRIYKAKLNTTKLQTVLKKYIKENVCCGECKGINTELKKNPIKGYDVHCVSCGSDRYLGYRD
jgi:translation initiation factor 2 subunit 3